MIKRLFTLFILSTIYLSAHGVFYKVGDKALGVTITSANNLAIANANVTVYAPSASLPFVKGNTDINGNFAFVPDSHGKWRINVDVPSDHGSHKKEFFIEVDKNFDIKSFEKMPLERYSKILNSLGILFGIFGVIALIKCRKKTKDTV